MAVAKDTVVVQLRWADRDRVGLRTLQVRCSSLDAAYAIVASAFEKLAAERGSTPSTFRCPPETEQQALGRKAQRATARTRQKLASGPKNRDSERRPHCSGGPVAADGAPAGRYGIGRIAWVKLLPPGRFAQEESTLLQVDVGKRALVLKLAARLCDLQPGTTVALDGAWEVGRFALASVLSQNGRIVLEVTDAVL